MSVHPPRAVQNPVEFSLHGDTRVDPYYWLRERDNPAVTDYLNAENAYTDQAMESTGNLQKTLYKEIRERVPDEDASAPVFDNDYWYYYRYEAGDEYPAYYRKHLHLSASEELVLDVRALAEGLDYLDVRGLDISRDNRWLAYTKDTKGRRLYELYLRDLRTGQDFTTDLSSLSPDPHWSNDSQHIFFTKKHPETLRENTVHRVRVDNGIINDPPELIFEELDEAFSLELGRTKCWDYLTIIAGSSVSTEYWLIDANRALKTPQLFYPRERDHEYYLDFDGQNFLVLSNKEASNFRLLQVSSAGASFEGWQELIAHRDDVYLEDFEVLQNFVVLEQKFEGLTRLEVYRRDSAQRFFIDFDDAAYSCSLNDNYRYETDTIRYGFESMITPDSTIDYDLLERTATVVLRDKVGGGFRLEDYRSERLWVEARDGSRIPVSLCWHKDTPQDGSAPLLQYGYGAYGHSIDADFSYSRISLLNRGFIYAIAHVRGGSELGRHWYDDGRLAKKINSFNDFIDVGDALVEAGRVDASRLCASGGSAGGLLMGAVINARPELYHAVIADVPFVDVLTTMLDESLPLTTGEYDEWGDPSEPDAYADMREYSPYDNVRAAAYPNVLVMAGLHDSQVQYWEPAKWAARLRDCNQEGGEILLYTNMGAGHGGASGRYEAIHETALAFAFLLKHATCESTYV